MLDYHVILDMIPQIAFLYFTGRLASAISVTGVQSSILLAIGLQRKVLEDVEKELGVQASQLLAMFVKVVRKVASHFRSLVEGAVMETMPAVVPAVADGLETINDTDEKGEGRQIFKPLGKSLDEDLKEGGEEVNKELKEKQRALIDALPLDKYEIETGAAGWEDAEKQLKRALHSKGDKTNEAVTVSVKSEKKDKKRKGAEMVSAEKIYNEEIGDREAKRLRKGMSKKDRDM